MNLLVERYIEFVDYYFGDRTNIPPALSLLRNIPELLDIHRGELNAAIHLFYRFTRTQEYQYPRLFINAELLAGILQNQELPDWEEIAQRLITTKPGDQSSELHLTFDEIGRFQFIDRMGPPAFSPLQLLGALFVAIYRTYTLVTRPSLRREVNEIALTIEEMLALLAINGCRTQLFDATKHFILDYEEEGFAQELAQKVATL